MSKLILPTDAQKKDSQWVDQYIEHAWLGLGDTSKLITEDPFLHKTPEEIENPALFILGLMRNPKNFSFTCEVLLNRKLAPFQLAILRVLWNHAFPMVIGSRGLGKSFLLAVYSMLQAIICPGTKVVVVGAAFRQAKVIFDYCQEIWDSSPMLRELYGGDKRNGPRRDVDRCSLRLGESIIIAVPLGDGSKIRGLRGKIVIADEFPSVPIPIFETVVRGFAAVSSDPIGKMIEESKIQAIKDLGMWSPDQDGLDDLGMNSNQVIVSGSAYYDFNHFANYWRRYKKIIESRGDPRKMEEIFGEKWQEVRWQDYAVIRIPAELLPPKFMDEKQILHARATIHKSIFMMEYAAVFSSDSEGFFKRSLIESCVVGKPEKEISHHSCGIVHFNAVLKGNPLKKYVIAVDPASEHDNLAISVLEIWPDHRRICHLWTTTRARHKAVLRAGLTEHQDYYRYSAARIRTLMRTFPCERLTIDSQGGGIAIIEALQDSKFLNPGERCIYPVIDPLKPADSDGMAGEHILVMVNFAQAQWVSEANHGMRKDFEDKALLFPNFDPAVVALALEDDKASGRVKVDQDGVLEKLYDTLEDCVLECEELKDELASIVHTQTGTSLRDRWDVPEIKQAGGKKGRMRKDRYSSLLMANMAARVLERTPVEQEYNPMGGFAQGMSIQKTGIKGPAYIGPAWWTERANGGLCGMAASRGVSANRNAIGSQSNRRGGR